MEIKDIIDKMSAGEIIALIGEVNLNCKTLPSFEENINVKDYLLKQCNKEKLLKALQVVELKEIDLDVNYNEESISLLNKLAIVEALISNDLVLVFDNINKGLTYRESQNIKRVLKMLADHNKKVIVISNDVEFLFNLTKRVIAVKNDLIEKEFYPVNWFDENIYTYVSKSPIIEFIDYCRNRNIKIEDSIETKELLKAIYRSVNK